MQKQTIYIAYGSNLNLPQMAYRCPTAELLGASQLPNYDLKFRGDDGHAVATVEPGDGSVPVLLWKLKRKDEAVLDLYEGWPHLYRKENMSVQLDGKIVEAMVYIMNGHDLGRPSYGYLNAIREGYESAGFDTAVLERAVEQSTPEQQEDMDTPQLDIDW